MTNLTKRARVIPRTVIGTTLQAARLPLTTLERVTGRRGNDEWPPAMAFESAEATVESMLGALLHDDELAARGRLRRTRLAKLRQAVELETLAEQERARAANELQARREETGRRREQVEKATEAKEHEVERQAEQRKQQVQKQAASRKQAVRKQAAATEKAVERQERQGRLEAADAQAAAVASEREALSAEDQALEIDSALEGTREQRKSG